MGSNRDIAFPNRKVRKIKFGLAIRKSIGQHTGIDTCKQAGEESCRKVTAKQQISQPSLPSKQPRNQATRQIGTCRQPGQQPTSERQEASKQCNKPASQPACQPSSQATSQQSSKPSSQPARQKQKTTKQKGREAQRDNNTYSQAGALLAQLHPGSTSLPQRDSIDKPLGSHCNPCLTETKHDLKAMKSK